MADFVDRPPHHLLFGQRRRVALATLLAMEPEVLDEPSSNLDVTVLMVTHDLPSGLGLCSHSVVLNEGLVMAGRPTYEAPTDDARMSAHRLELPGGFESDLLDAGPAAACAG